MSNDIRHVVSVSGGKDSIALHTMPYQIIRKEKTHGQTLRQ